MVIKFKIAKTGRRFQANLKPDSLESQSPPRVEKIEKHVEVDTAGTSSRQLFQPPVNRKRSVDATENDGKAAEISGTELSFILSIFPDGYSIVDAPESKILQQNPVKYCRKFLKPYDRSSESLITTVECGLLPVNFLDGIECKYFEGKVLCEVRDYRKNFSDMGTFDYARAPFPTIKKLSLQMTLDDVVKDLHLISDSTWGYGDLLEAESRILNAIQPKLYLDPKPNFERLCRRPNSIKLNLDIRGMRLKRLRQSSATERSVRGQPDFVNSRSTSPKNYAPNASVASSSSGSGQSSYQIGVENPGHMQDAQMSSMVISDKGSRLNQIAIDGNQSLDHSINARESVPKRSVMGQPDFMNTISASPSHQAPNASIVASSSVSCQSSNQIGVENPRHEQDGQMSSMVISDKRSRLNPIALDGNQSLDHSIHARESVPEISVMGQLDFVNTTSTGLIHHAPNVSNAASSSIPCQPSYQFGDENHGHMQDGLLSSMVVSDKRSRLNPMAPMGQLDFVNTTSTQLINHAPNVSNAASSISCQPSYQNGVENQGHMQDGLLSSMVVSDRRSRLNSLSLDANQSLNHSINARESVPERSVTGQLDFVNTVSTGLILHAPNSSNAESSSVSGPSSYQIGVENPGHLQDGLLSSMVVSDKRSRLNPMALDANQSLNHSFNARESVAGRSVTAQLDFVNTVSTGLIHHAPNASNAASSLVSRQPSYQIGVENPGNVQDGLLSSMVVSDKRSRLNPMALDANRSLNHSINARESVPERSVTGQLDFVNTVSTGLIHHTPNASNVASSSRSRQPGYQIGVENPQHMQDGQMSSMVISDEGSWLNPIALDGNQSLDHSINARASVPGSSVMGQPDFVNTLSTRPVVHAQNTSIAGSSSVFGQSSNEIGVRNARHMQDGQMSSSMVISDKGSRLNPIALDGYQSRNHSINARESMPVHHQSTIQQILNGSSNQYNIKQEPVETERINRLPQQFTRANFNHAPWNNMSPKLENNTIKKEVSNETRGLQTGGVTSVPVGGRTRSLTSNVNESTQRAKMTSNLRSNSLVRCGAGSSASSSSTPNRIGRPPNNSIDLHLRDRFAKIQLLTSRFKLNCKTDKTDNIKPKMSLPSKQFMHVLFYDHLNNPNNSTPNEENETCELPLSMSRVGGNVNICKTRIITFVKNERMLPGNEFLLTPKYKSRLILSERQSAGTVAMHYGELDKCDYLAEEILLPTFPNTHSADLFASEFCSMMLLDGYRIESDHIKPKPVSTVQSTNGQPYGVFTDTLIQQFQASISNQLPIRLISEHDRNPKPSMQPQRRGSSSSSSRSRLNPMGQNSRLGGQMKIPHGQSPMGIKPGSSISNAIKHRETGTLFPGHAANAVPTKNRMAERGMIMPSGFGAQSRNLGTLQGANRQENPGSGSTGVSIPGSGINRANETNPMQRNVMPPPRFTLGMNQNQNQNQNQNRYMNQQQMHFIKQEPGSELQAVRFPVQQVGSPSSSFGMIQQYQSSSQQMSQLNQMSPQISSGVNHPFTSSGNQDGESSQTFGYGGTMDFTRM